MVKARLGLAVNWWGCWLSVPQNLRGAPPVLHGRGNGQVARAAEHVQVDCSPLCPGPSVWNVW